MILIYILRTMYTATWCYEVSMSTAIPDSYVVRRLLGALPFATMAIFHAILCASCSPVFMPKPPGGHMWVKVVQLNDFSSKTNDSIARSWQCILRCAALISTCWRKSMCCITDQEHIIVWISEGFCHLGVHCPAIDWEDVDPVIHCFMLQAICGSHRQAKSLLQ